VNKLRRAWGRFLVALSVLRVGHVGHVPDWARILSYYFNEHTVIEVIKEDTFDPLNQRVIGCLVIRYTRPDNVWTSLDPELLPRRAEDMDKAIKRLGNE